MQQYFTSHIVEHYIKRVISN